MTTFSADHHNTTHNPKRGHTISCGSPNKMLASTMQLTNNNPHHTTTHNQTPRASAWPATTTPHPTHPQHTVADTQNMDPVVPGPNSVPNTHQHQHHQTLSTPHRGRTHTQQHQQPVTARTLPQQPHRPTQDLQARRFVDVPPMSNSPAHERDCNEPFFLTTLPQPHRTRRTQW